MRAAHLQRSASVLCRHAPSVPPLQQRHSQQLLQSADPHFRRHKHQGRRKQTSRPAGAQDSASTANTAAQHAAPSDELPWPSQGHRLQRLPTTVVGQVMAAEANYVRVDISGPATAEQLETPDGAATSSGGATSSGSGSGSGGAGALPRRQLLCTLRAMLKKMRQSVLVGDRVVVDSADWTSGRGVVARVLPRSSQLLDPAIANIDHVLLLFGLTQPPFEPQQVSRFLVSVEAAGLPLTLALNKADLVQPQEVARRLEQLAGWGYPRAVAVSCESGQGLEQLAERLAGRTSVVAGPSGAGKSSLINALRCGRVRPEAPADAGGWGGGDARLGARLAPAAARAAGGAARAARGAAGAAAGGPTFQAVGEVSRGGRGRHTTRSVSLLALPGGGRLADTPGFNQPALDAAESVRLWRLFPELQAAVDAAGGCRFGDCSHTAEPGCALGGGGAYERYPHYLKFLDEVKVREEHDATVLQMGKKQREGATKVVTGRGGRMRLEALLEPKRHRVVSRRRSKQDALAEEAAAEAAGEV